MTDNPQQGCPIGYWQTHDGAVFIDDMPDEHVLNAYKTCLRHDNPKATELMRELERRNIDWRI